MERVDEAVAGTFYPDCDGDDFGSGEGTMVSGCTPPSGSPGCGTPMEAWSFNDRDCDDTNPGRNPGAPEVCDGLDNDCDGLLDGPGEDADGDGFPACADIEESMRDCDDGDPTINPAADELCDGRDTNCREEPGLPDAAQIEDNDGDGHADLSSVCVGGALPKDDCDDENESVFLGAGERCDGIDNDCDELVDEDCGALCEAADAGAFDLGATTTALEGCVSGCSDQRCIRDCAVEALPAPSDDDCGAASWSTSIACARRSSWTST